MEARGVVEDLGIGPIAYARAGVLAAVCADDAQLRRPAFARLLERGVGGRCLGVGIRVHAGMALVEFHAVCLAVAVHFHVQAGAQGVDHGGAHAVQASDRVVGAVSELAAGVELREHHFHAGQPCLGLDVDGDAAAIVLHGDGSVAVQRHGDAVACAGERLVNGIVDDLPQAVHEPLGVGRSYVHAGAFAHGVKTFEDGEVRRVVFRFLVLGLLRLCLCHVLPSSCRAPLQHAADGKARRSGLCVYLLRKSLRVWERDG